MLAREVILLDSAVARVGDSPEQARVYVEAKMQETLRQAGGEGTIEIQWERCPFHKEHGQHVGGAWHCKGYLMKEGEV